ncbi:ribosome small subunit-dependent GTPase A [Yinghuangia seranimata]|uniref:ribosome small subunit-dependent GTPase A n=1 Tax=Yinghuangia seranimata TaxID=408067 RepID=UPI00248CF3A4|nr:ribosome small subunit-dependent GTPase A [Yinghuangia seranimata]MDI2128060.1 ribosome small subunit-dependent GTPase A [Yinghuangia seranimata]
MANARSTRRTDFDEDDVRIRPSRRGSRPRTRIRPKHEDAETGRVLTIDRGRFTCLVDEGTRREHEVTAMKARELGRKGVVVGDRVAIVGDVSGDKGALARIVRVEERDSVLRRTADDDDPFERIIVANADQLAIVTALADPEPRPRLIDRCLVAAYDAGMEPLLVLTKADLAPPETLLELYGALGVPYVVTRGGDAYDDWDLDPIYAELAGLTTVFVGHSGVGKTTLVNALVPDRQRATGHVNEVTGRGRHTTTSALTLRLPPFGEDREQGWVVDTPGVRSFGLNHVDLGRIIHAFPDLEPGTVDCPRACSHDEQDCALDAWVSDGHADPARLTSLRRLLATRERAEGD